MISNVVVVKYADLTATVIAIESVGTSVGKSIGKYFGPSKNSHSSKSHSWSRSRGSPVSILLRIIFGVAAASDPESRGQTEALPGGMEEAYRSPVGTPGDQGRVSNPLQCASSHGQAAKAVREGLKETSGKGRRAGDYKSPLQKSYRGSFSSAARILLKDIHRPKEEWRNTDGPQPETFKPVYPRAAFQNGITEHYLTNVAKGRLDDKHRSQRCFLARAHQQGVKKISQVHVGPSHLPVQGTAIWSVLKPASIHQNTKASSQVGQSSRDPNLELLGRFAGLGINQKRVYQVHCDGCKQASQARVHYKQREVVNEPQAVNQPFGYGHQHPPNELQDSQAETQGSHARGIQTDQEWEDDAEMLSIFHWQDTGSEHRSPSRQTHEQEAFGAQECHPADHAGLEHRSIFGSASSRQPDLVERSSEGMERPELPPRDSGSGSLHRRKRLPLGDSYWSEPVLRNMDQSTVQAPDQRQGATSHIQGYQDAPGKGQECGCILRQQHLHQLCQETGRDQIAQPARHIGTDVETLHQQRDQGTDPVRTIHCESGRRPIPAYFADRMVDIGKSVSKDSKILWSSRYRHVCEQHQSQTEHICELEILPPSSQDQRLQPQLDSVEESIHVSTVESDPAYHPEDPSGEDHSDSDHAVLEISPVVSGPEEPVNCTANQDSSVSSYPRPEKRKSSDNAQQDMVTYGLAVKRARYQEAGLDDQVINLMLDNTRVKTKQKKYLSPKTKFLQWLSTSSISIENVTVVDVINYLEQQRKALNWRLGTVKNYKSAILDITSDWASFSDDPLMKEYLKQLSSSNVRSFDNPLYDIGPIIDHIRKLGPNSRMSKYDLTAKLCWLIAICGFLRPSDIERIDDSKTSVTREYIKFIIVGPKEKRNGTPIEKVSIIHAHSDKKLCPVETYQVYKKRIAVTPCVKPHPLLDGNSMSYLIRSLKDHTICDFLRPSDIERIDDRKTSVTREFIKFIIVGPKEKRNGTPIEKVSIIHAHSDKKLCPVETYQVYKKRIAVTPCVKPHPLLDGNSMSYLIRSLKDHSTNIGAQRISKQINKLMSLIPLPPNAKVPKARALGSTRATSSGATYDDVITQGFWTSRGIFDTYYQLSRRTRENLTLHVLNSEAT
ncbi:hypothetical protein AX774_g2394 [Zancudomyces culisetae]|uniref:Core-binding (CB) domain-containing protein n=1 Tax=Zancudomyces culisetae TaxID=1213189 RepID=A0A1R1PSZ7_ZANCU|nr:hypothetical protein AX774_g2394 [Zancudomyces culisetae]|eukprot:OMH84088.1 hypothetical protein AX774_g2394 [Zancudomyces culisetae]